MKNNKFKVVQSLVAVVAAAMMIGSASAGIVYDNSSVYSGKFFVPVTGLEFGDEINLVGSERNITDFKFEYFTSLASEVGRTAQLRIYANNGAVSPGVDQHGALRPGSVLYDSGTFGLKNGFNTVDISGISVLNVPNKLTWTVFFGGLSGSDSAGLPIYETPTSGTSLDDFWQNSGGTWTLFRFPGGSPKGNFAAQVTAIPEASTVYLALAGGVLLFGFQIFRRSVKRA